MSRLLVIPIWGLVCFWLGTVLITGEIILVMTVTWPVTWYAGVGLGLMLEVLAFQSLHLKGKHQ